LGGVLPLHAGSSGGNDLVVRLLIEQGARAGGCQYLEVSALSWIFISLSSVLVSFFSILFYESEGRRRDSFADISTERSHG
jgi:hypothetical protein